MLATQVQAELGKPSLLQPDRGKVSIHIDCSPTAEPAFEVGYSIALLPLCLMKSSEYSGFPYIM